MHCSGTVAAACTLFSRRRHAFLQGVQDHGCSSHLLRVRRSGRQERACLERTGKRKWFNNLCTHLKKLVCAETVVLRGGRPAPRRAAKIDPPPKCYSQAFGGMFFCHWHACMHLQVIFDDMAAISQRASGGRLPGRPARRWYALVSHTSHEQPHARAHA